MIQFTTGDMVVILGKPCLVRGFDDINVKVLTVDGEYVTITIEDIESVYID